MEQRLTPAVVFLVAVAFCAGVHAQDLTAGQSARARAQGLREMKLSDVYDKTSGTYFQPVLLELIHTSLPDNPQFSQKAIKIAFLDTGLLHNHPHFKNFKIEDKDFTGEGPEDENGHGTVMTLLAVGVLTYYGGAQGSSNVELLNVKVLGRDGTSDSDDIKKGMQWAVDQGAEILSMSLVVPKSANPDVCALAAKLIKENHVRIVAAAGNDPKVPVCPALGEGVISAGAEEVKSAMEPTITRSSEMAFLPMPAEPPAGQEITCATDIWRAAYLWFFAIPNLFETKNLVKKCPETAKAVANQLLNDSGAAFEKRECDKIFEFAGASFQIAFERDDAWQKGIVLNQAGTGHICKDEWSKAAVMFSRAAKLGEMAHYPRGQETALKNLGLTEVQTHEFARSVGTLKNALELARLPEIADRQGEPQILENLCTSYFALGKLDEAEENCEQAGTKAFFQKDNHLICRTTLHRGIIKLKKNDRTSAQKLFQSAIFGCTLSHDPEYAKSAAQRLSEMADSSGQPPER
jgi:hypothetical protein